MSTYDYLRKHAGNYRFLVCPITLGGLRKCRERSSLHFVSANVSVFVPVSVSASGPHLYLSDCLAEGTRESRVCNAAKMFKFIAFSYIFFVFVLFIFGLVWFGLSSGNGNHNSQGRRVGCRGGGGHAATSANTKQNDA